MPPVRFMPFLLNTGLTSPPQNVHATAVSSTAINVIWEEVPVINGNGIIITYEVQVEPLDFNDSLTIIYVNTTNLLLVITGLQEYVEYNIRVRAFNTIGPGPFSPPATERTLEDGTYFYVWNAYPHIDFYNNIILCHVISSPVHS